MHNNIVYKLVRPKTFKKYSRALRIPNSEYVVVKFLYCGICGGDHSSFSGRRDNYPVSLGHEFIAEVVETNTTITHFKKGDFVVSDFNYRCYDCEYCRNNQSHLCNKNNIKKFSNRAFSSYSSIHYSYLLEVNDISHNILSGTLIEPLSCVIHAYDLLKANHHDRILIVGVGNIGTLFAFFLRKVLKMSSIFVYDTVNKKEASVIKKFGCFRHDVNNKYDIVVEATNSVEGLEYAIKSSDKSKKLCSISHLYGLNSSKCLEEIQKRELECIFPLRNGEFSNVEKAYKIVNEHWRIDYNSLFSISNINIINKTFSRKHKNKYNKQIIKCN